MPLPCKILSGKVHLPLLEALLGHVAALSKLQEMQELRAPPTFSIALSLFHLHLIPSHPGKDLSGYNKKATY